MHMMAVGRIVTWSPVKGISVNAIVHDVRTVWGRVDYLLTPVSGRGQVWVDSTRTTLVAAVEPCDAS